MKAGLPHCRHRGLEVQPLHWTCNSDKLDILGGVVTEEVCRQHCPFVDHPDENQSTIVTADSGPAVHARSAVDKNRAIPIAHDPSLLSIAMITAPRPVKTVERSIAELRKARFPQRVHLFAEPDVDLAVDSTVEIRSNLHKLGAWCNWIRAAQTMLEIHPSPFILICEDDIQLASCAGLALQHACETLPQDTWGYASLYSPQHNLPGPTPIQGWQSVHVGEMWGALAWCFTRDSLRAVLQSQVVHDHGSDKDTDVVISDAVFSISRQCYFHVPSLCQHTGDRISTLGHLPLEGSTAVGFSRDYNGYVVAREERSRGHSQAKHIESARASSPTARDHSITVVVPTFNCGTYLHDCLVSLQRQTVSCDIVVVDDGSTDNTPELLRQFGDRIQVCRHRENRGANAARRTGLDATRSTWVLFADADAVYQPRYLERLLAGSDGGVSVVYCAWERHNVRERTVETLRAVPFDSQKLWWHNYISMCSLVRRAVLPEPREGGLAESNCFDDWALWLALAANGCRFTPVDEILFSALERPEGKTAFVRSSLHRCVAETARVRRLHPTLVGLDEPLAVVIPAKDSLDLTKGCLWHLARYSGIPLSVVYVDNGSRSDVAERVAEFADFLELPIDVVGNQRNEQFTVAVNQGLQHCGDRHAICLNNDCFVGPECIERLYWHMATGDRVAAVGPLTGDGQQQSLRHQFRRRQAGVAANTDIDYVDAIAGFQAVHGPPRARDESMVAFFCTLLNREAIWECGLLDEQTRQFRSGLGADDEWCLRARNRGWRIQLALDAYAVHLGQQTFHRLGMDRDAMQRQAMAAFKVINGHSVDQS